MYSLNSSEVAYTYQVSPYAGKPADITDPSDCQETNCSTVTTLYYEPKTLEVVKYLLKQVGWERLKGCHLTTGEFDIFTEN